MAVNWKTALRAVAIALAFIASWLLFQPARAAVPPYRPVSVTCDRETRVPAVRIGQGGRMEVSYRAPNGCVFWRAWMPMVRPR